MKSNRWIVRFLIVTLHLPYPAASLPTGLPYKRTIVEIKTLTEDLLFKEWESGRKMDISPNVRPETNMLPASEPAGKQVNVSGPERHDAVPFLLAPPHFRSNQSGLWHDPECWEISTDSLFWEPSKQSPDENSKSVVIHAPHIMTINKPAKVNAVKVFGQLTVGTGGSIEFSGENETGITVESTGVVEVATSDSYDRTLRIQPTTGKRILQTKTNGKVVINKPLTGASGSGFETLALDPLNIWEHAAEFRWNNGLAFKTSNITYFPNSAGNSIPIFTIGPNRTEEKLTNGNGYPLVINGLLHVTADITLAGGGAKVFRNGITGNAVLKQDGSIDNPGNFYITGEQAILGGNGLRLVLTYILNLESDVEIPEDAEITIIKENGNSTRGSILKRDAHVFTINGKLDLTDINMSNPDGSVQVNGHLKTAASNGLKKDGSSSVTGGTLKLNPGSTVEYSAQENQEITSSTALGSSYYHLILSGNGVKKPTSLINIHSEGSLKISGGPELIIDASANNIGPTDNDNHTRFIMEGGTLILGTGGTLPLMKGDYQITGGTIEFAGNSPKTIRGEKYHNITVTGSNVGNSSGTIGIKPDGSFVIKSGGVFTGSNGNAAIAGVDGTGQTLRIENGGIFKTAVQPGFYGAKPDNIIDASPSVQNSISKVILEKGSTIEYGRAAYSLPSSAATGDQIITLHENIYQYQNLILSGNGNKTTSSGHLEIRGDFTIKDSAVFLPDQSSVLFTGNNEVQVLDVNGAVFSNLENRNSKMLRIDSDLSVTGSLKLSENSRLHLQSGNITVVSDEHGTGRVERIPGSAEITYNEQGGRFRIERFIPEHPKAWQLLSVPASGGTIRESWQNNQEETKERGVNITSPGFTNDDPKGFDGYSPAPSMKYYNSPTNLYTGVSSTNNIISEHAAYFLFVRGDRSVYNAKEPSTAVTIHTRGKLYDGTSVIPPTTTIEPGRYELIGNPYASSVNFEKISMSSNLQKSYTIWDPLLTNSEHSAYGLGGFREVTPDGRGGYIVVPSGGNYIDGSAPIIQSGQAFFIYNPSDTRGIVSFTEDAKDVQDINVFRVNTGSVNPIPEIRTNLYLIREGGNVLLDGTLQFFGNDFSSEVDQLDSRKMLNSGENIAIASDRYPLIIERRQLPDEKDTVFYSVTGLKSNSYLLEVSLNKSASKHTGVFLADALTGQVSELHEGSNKLDFSVENNEHTLNPFRFYLTFNKIKKQTHFTDETVSINQNSVVLKWKISDRTLIKNFEIEHRTENSSFKTIGSLKISDRQRDYFQFVHHNPPAGINHYRIKAFQETGEIIVSKTPEILIGGKENTIEIFPNPVKDYLQLRLKNQPAGTYSFNLYSPDGRSVVSGQFIHTATTNHHELLLSRLSRGIYQLVIVGPDKNISKQTVFIDP